MLINKEELIGLFKEEIEYQKEQGFYETEIDGLEYGLHLIERFKSSWIPTSKRQPNEDDFIKSYIRHMHAAEFIVMIKGANRPTALYFRRPDWWVDEKNKEYDVIAWMPLPEPYVSVRKESEDESI